MWEGVEEGSKTRVWRLESGHVTSEHLSQICFLLSKSIGDPADSLPDSQLSFSSIPQASYFHKGTSTGVTFMASLCHFPTFPRGRITARISKHGRKTGARSTKLFWVFFFRFPSHRDLQSWSACTWGQRTGAGSALWREAWDQVSWILGWTIKKALYCYTSKPYPSISVIKLIFYVQLASVSYLSIAKLRRVRKEYYLLVPKTQTYWWVGRNLEDKGWEARGQSNTWRQASPETRAGAVGF